jgi:hypothetical protein
MALLKDVHPFIAEILEGKHDDILDQVTFACKARLKSRFRKGMTVRLVGTGNPEAEGKVGVVTRVNQKTVAVGCGTYDREWETYEDGEYNVPPRMLEVVTSEAAAAFAAKVAAGAGQ